MEFLPELVPINCYNVERGKLNASVSWLIGRVYGSSIPDLLQNPVRVNENNTFYLTTAVITGLTNCSLYSNAAAKIFKDHSLVNKSHGVILRSLGNHSIPILISGEEAKIDEATLSSVHPFQQAFHLALIDALMMAHMRSIITIERVINAIEKYTTVDRREEPMDGVDALLFWINKICLLVRDDMEKFQDVSDGNIPQAIVPEMEDLYEDMCDGACVAAVVAFYRPNDFSLREICFNDPMSVADCQYNLQLLRRFCRTLPSDCFYFDIEDILYLHECLQPNVNALLSDLFFVFEGPQETVAPIERMYPRRLANIAGIPGLRTHNNMESGLKRGKTTKSDVIRAVSVMSTDSLMGNRFAHLLHKNRSVTVDSNDTINFGQLGLVDLNASGDAKPAVSNANVYTRSDSMPAASIRLALEEKRREHEKKRYLQNNQNQSDRVQIQRDAFFTLMQRLEKNSGSDGRSRTMSEYGAPSAREMRSLKETVEGIEKKLLEMSLQQEQLSRQIDGQRMSHATSQPSINSDFRYMHDHLQHSSMSNYATLPHNVARSGMISSQHTYAMPYANSVSHMGNLSGQVIYQPADQMRMYHQAQQLSTSPSVPTLSHRIMSVSNSDNLPPCQNGVNVTTSQHCTPQCVMPTSPAIIYSTNYVDDSQNSFRLHENNASTSRLDPALEINHNLTNWGLTYKAGYNMRPQRRTWENETFVKNDMDSVNQSSVAPYVSSERDQKPPVSSSFPRSGIQPSSITKHVPDVQLRNYSCYPESEIYRRSAASSHQASPPKDPTVPISALNMLKQRQSTTGGSQFIVQDGDSEKPALAITREMEAKREALMAKTLRRREKIEQKFIEIEAKNSERRIFEIEKQEAIEQRKRERDLQKQKILEDYKRKKIEKDIEMNGIHNGRGHSQPPATSRTKSSVENVRTRTLQRHIRGSGSFDENGSAPSSPRISVPSTAEPTLKLFAKYVPKSNRSMIINALQYSVLPGTVWEKQRNEVLGELAKSDSKQLLLLFRDQKCRYLGAYSWDQQSDTTHRIHGRGPSICTERMMNLMFKYDSGAKTFSLIPTKHLSATIDGFTLRDQYGQAPKIPHSGNARGLKGC